MRSTIDKGALLEAYRQTGSVWKAGSTVGVSGQTAHAHLARMGAVVPVRVFTPAERDRLRAEYSAHANAGTLDALAASMGRTKAFLCRQARALGLTNQRRPQVYRYVWKDMPEAEARVIFEAFKASPLQMKAYCEANGYDDLGFSRTMEGHFPDEWDAIMEAKVDPDSLYAKGRAFEFRARRELLAGGYFVARSPRSVSPADLVAFRTGCVALVQCRLGGAGIGREEWNILFDLAESIGAVALFARAEDGAVRFYRLTGRKTGERRAQPMERWSP